MGNESKDGLGAVLLEDGSGLDESAASVGHVIDKDGDLVLDVTDKSLSHKSTFQSLNLTISDSFLPCDQQRWGGGAPCG